MAAASEAVIAASTPRCRRAAPSSSGCRSAAMSRSRPPSGAPSRSPASCSRVARQSRSARRGAVPRVRVGPRPRARRRARRRESATSASATAPSRPDHRRRVLGDGWRRGARVLARTRFLERLARLWTPSSWSTARSIRLRPGGDPWAAACRRGRHVVLSRAMHLANLDRPRAFSELVAAFVADPAGTTDRSVGDRSRTASRAGPEGAVMEWLAPRPGERILDLGCGDGVLTAELFDAAAPMSWASIPAQISSAAARARGLDARADGRPGAHLRRPSSTRSSPTRRCTG